MNVNNLISIQAQEPFYTQEEEQEYTWQEKVSSLVKTNITGAARILEAGKLQQYDKDFDITSKEAQDLIFTNGYEASEYDKFEDATSLDDLKNKIKFNNDIRNSYKIVDSMGGAGVAGSFLTAFVDPVGWTIGGGIGKAGQLILKATEATGKAYKVGQGVTAATSGVAAYAAMEKSINGELTTEGALINGSLSFGLGYALSRNPMRTDNVQKVLDNGVEISGAPKQNFLLSFMHSSADRLKESDNAAARAVGYASSRSMNNVGLQNQTTANDYLSEYAQQTTQFKQEYDNFRQEFQKSEGRKFDENDEVEVQRLGLDTDHKVNLFKDNYTQEQQQITVEQRKQEALTKIDEEINQIKAKISEENNIPIDNINIETTPLASKGLTTSFMPKKLGSPKPSFYGKPIEFKDDVSKSIYIAGSKNDSKSKSGHLEWLKDELGLDDATIAQARQDMLKDIKEGNNVKPIGEYIPQVSQQSKVNISDTIKQKVDNKKIDGIQKQLDDIQSKIDNESKLLERKTNVLKYKKRAKSETSAINKEFKSLEKQLQKLQKERAKLDAQKTNRDIGKQKTANTKAKKQLDASIIDIQAKMTKANEKLAKFENIDKTKTQSEIKKLEASKKNIKKILEDEKKKIKAQEAEIKKRNKQAEKELQDKIKSKNKIDKEYDNYTFKDEELANIRNNARAKAKEYLDNLMSEMNPQYRKVVDMINKRKKIIGEDINSTNLHGMKDLDTNFYWSRQYSVDKVANNPEGAVKAFTEAMKDNYTKVDKDLEDKLTKKARGVVESILKANSNYESIDAHIGLIQARDLKLNAKDKSLKSRKLRLNGSKLLEFMDNDIVHNLEGYNRKVGGELALKKSLGVDNNYTVDKLAIDKQISGKDRKFLDSVVTRIKGTSEIDPRSNSMFSKVVRGFNQVNYLNFGGWFGVNTLSDLANIGYDFGMDRTIKYATQDIIKAASEGKTRQSKAFANNLGLAAESLTNDRAILMGGESFAQGNHFTGEKTLMTMGAAMSKLNGMNMVIDLMDRTVAMTALDYVLTASPSAKFTKTMNRLGLSPEDVNRIRQSSSEGFVNFNSNGFIDKINLNKLDDDLRFKLERGIKRAARDTVLRANELDSPDFLSEIGGSQALAKALFQFLRFPVVAYNKLGIKMKENWDTADAIVSTMTAMGIVGMALQLKDIGKEEKRYDMSTKEGSINTLMYTLERVPHLSGVSIPQNYIDFMGRAKALLKDEEYKGRGDVNLGIAFDRVNQVAEGMNRLSKGDLQEKDFMTAKTFVPFQNLFFLNPFNNMANDYIKGE